MKYIKKFSQVTEYQQFVGGGDYVTPNVCYIVENNGLVIEPYVNDYAGLFPAIIVPAGINGNITNAKIAQYFIDNYPNMITNIGGNYTPITEDVTINGTNYCDGKVIGVASWYNNSDYIAILFYTSNSIENYYGLKMFIKDNTVQPGLTSEYFYD